jgi:hypothetical protein
LRSRDDSRCKGPKKHRCGYNHSFTHASSFVSIVVTVRGWLSMQPADLWPRPAADRPGS